MRALLRLALLSMAFALGTWALGWITVPVIASSWGVIAARERAPLDALLGAVVGWVALLAVAAASGPVGAVAHVIGGVVGVPSWAPLLATLVFAAVTAWSAAVVGREIGRAGRARRDRRPARGELSRAAAMVLALFALTSCDRRVPATSDTAADARFDPAALRVGDTVAGMTVDRVDVSRDSEGRVVGTVAFTGERTLSGRYHPHFDHPEVRATCFAADDSSAALLPRFPDDERRVWFCFANQDEAARSLGPPGTSGDATIVIDRYTTIRSFSDAVDSAELVRVLSRAPESSGGPPPGPGP